MPTSTPTFARIGCQGNITEQMHAEEGAIEALHKHMRRYLRGFGADHGLAIAEGDVVIWTLPQRPEDRATSTIRMRAVWAPWRCELLGGEHDGTVMPIFLPVDPQGIYPEILNVPNRRSSKFDGGSDAPRFNFDDDYSTYHYAGIDSDAGRAVYTIRPQKNASTR